MPAKQTLFEAEGVISVRFDEMSKGIDQAVKQAEQQIKQRFGAINAQVGGSRASGRGGKSQIESDIAARERMLNLEAERLKIEGDLAGAAERYRRIAQDSTQPLDKQTRAANRLLQIQKEMSEMDRRSLAEARKRAETGIGEFTKGREALGRNITARIQQQTRAELQLAQSEVQVALAAGNVNLAMQHQQSVLRQLTPGTAAYNRELTRLQRMQQTHGDQLNHMTPAQRRFNAVMQNASFGIQDFAIVIGSGGGLSRALAAASNNLAFMLQMAGGAGAAIAGVAVTIGAVFLPQIVRFITGVEDAGKVTQRFHRRIKDLVADIHQLSKLEDFDIRLGRMIEADDAGGIGRLRDETAMELGVAQNRLEMLRNRATETREAAIEKFKEELISILGIARIKFDDEIAPQLKGLLEDIRAGRKVEKDDVPLGFKGAFENLIDRIQPFEDELAAAGRAVEDLSSQESRLRQVRLQMIQDLEDAARFKEGGVTPFEKAMRDLARINELVRAGALTQEEAAKAAKPIQDRINELQRTPLQREIDRQSRKDKDAAIKAQQEKIRGTETITDTLFGDIIKRREFDSMFTDAWQTLMDSKQFKDAFQLIEGKQIFREAQEAAKRPDIAGTFGPDQFASQLTNQLLQRDPMDEVAKWAEKNHGLLDTLTQTAKDQKEILERIEESGGGLAD